MHVQRGWDSSLCTLVGTELLDSYAHAPSFLPICTKLAYMCSCARRGRDSRAIIVSSFSQNFDTMFVIICMLPRISFFSWRKTNIFFYFVFAFYFLLNATHEFLDAFCWSPSWFPFCPWNWTNEQLSWLAYFLLSILVPYLSFTFTWKMFAYWYSFLLAIFLDIYCEYENWSVDKNISFVYHLLVLLQWRSEKRYNVKKVVPSRNFPHLLL